MKLYDEMSVDERREFDESIDFDGGRPLGIDIKFPDGRYYDWDPVMNGVVEVMPDGKRFLVELRGSEIVRVREILTPSPVAAA